MTVTHSASLMHIIFGWTKRKTKKQRTHHPTTKTQEKKLPCHLNYCNMLAIHMTIFVCFVLRTWKFIVSLNSFWNIYTDVGIYLSYLYCPIFAVLFVFNFFSMASTLTEKRKKKKCEWVAFKNLLSEEKCGAMLMCIGKCRNYVYLQDGIFRQIFHLLLIFAGFM